MKKPHPFQLALTALLIALVFLATMLIQIKLPIKANGGLVHFGTAMLFIVSIVFGPKKGAMAGAIGMALFDVVGGWLIWAPITLVARGLQGWIVGTIAWSGDKQGASTLRNVIAMTISMPLMAAVYYVGEVVLYGSWIAPLASIPGDAMQSILGIIVAIPVCRLLQRTAYFKRFAA